MKIRIMKCSWNTVLEGKTLDVEKITSRNPTTKQLLTQILLRLDKIDQRIDNLVSKNNLAE